MRNHIFNSDGPDQGVWTTPPPDWIELQKARIPWGIRHIILFFDAIFGGDDTGQNPHRLKRGDYMYDRGDGNWDRVLDSQLVSQLEDERLTKRDTEGKRQLSDNAITRMWALTANTFGWIPRAAIRNHGDPTAYIWDPEHSRWFLRSEVPAGRHVPIRPDQSSGDGSGA